MTTAFDALFCSAGFPALLNQFGESVVYKPRNGGSRTIHAIVEREPPSIYDAAGNVVSPKVTIRVLNNKNNGIASSELDTVDDKIQLTYKIGTSRAQDFQLIQLHRHHSPQNQY